MRFNPKARLDTSRTRDSGRGRGGGGGLGGSGGGSGRGIPIPGGIGTGGIGGVIIVVLFLVVTQCLGGTDSTGGSSAPATGTEIDSNRYESCQTGDDANNSADCARVAVEDSLTAYWSQVLPEQAPQVSFTPPQVQTFTDAVSTGGCGEASADVGPFYCPTDQVIYLDTSFFQTVLEGQLGGSGGDFVEPYVIGHEYGHHIQNLLGTMSQVRTQQGRDSDAVRLELQADCYAGMWTHGALETTDDSGVKIFESLDQADIQEALDAAKTVGDDLIQKRTQGRVDPEGWTHGSSAERQRWFSTGYAATDLAECDTFSADQL
jgi:predicted metalloprotease